MIIVCSEKTQQEKTIYENEWLSIKKLGQYYFSHEERCNGRIVAVLGWRKKNNKAEILGRYERCPCHKDGIALCALTGGMEERIGSWIATGRKYAQLELEEESGIKISKSRFVNLGTTRPSKSADTFVHLFSIELNKEEPVKNPKGDGSEGEKDAYCKWVSIEQAINCKDPIMHALVLRANI